MKKINNFLPNQYKQTEKLPINYNYLWNNLNSNTFFMKLMLNLSVTLGKKVILLKKFAKITNCKYNW